MDISVQGLIGPVSTDQVDAARAWNASNPMGRGPRNRAELEKVRTLRVPTDLDPAAVDEAIEFGGKAASVRILTPSEEPPRGVLLDIHGGGFYMDSAARSDTRNRRIAAALGIAVVSVDYRLAPENPWPAAPDDCETAARWLVEHAVERFGTGRLAIGGASAGATLAMTTLIRLRDSGIAHAFAGAVLRYGTYDLSGLTPAGRLIADEYFLEAYVGHVADRTVPDISPIYATLVGLPPLLMVVGALDILLDDNLAMAARLVTAGVDVDLRVYPEARHGFTTSSSPMSATAVSDMDRWLDRRLSH